jgi:hypothetical protein
MTILKGPRKAPHTKGIYKRGKKSHLIISEVQDREKVFNCLRELVLRGVCTLREVAEVNTKAKRASV